eukprot:Nk52_evm14s317 gene=Nk52_evmTU14s317
MNLSQALLVIAVVVFVCGNGISSALIIRRNAQSGEKNQEADENLASSNSSAPSSALKELLFSNSSFAWFEPTGESFASQQSATRSSQYNTLISNMVANGPIDNKYDAYMVYTVGAINQIYKKFAKSPPPAMAPFKVTFNTTLPKASLPFTWGLYEVEFYFESPVFDVDADMKMVLSQTISKGSSFGLTKGGPGYPPYGPIKTDVEGPGFKITAPLSRVQGDVHGDLVSLDFTQSSVTLPDVQVEGKAFADAFENYWKNSSHSKIFFLGRLPHSIDGLPSALSPHDFQVCSILASPSPYVVVVMNTGTTSDKVELPSNCYDIFPQAVYPDLVPEGHDISLFLSAKNMKYLLNDVMHEAIGMQMSFDENFAKVTQVRNLTLGTINYAPLSACKTSYHVMYGDECNKPSPQPFPHTPTFSSDVSVGGESSFKLSFNTNVGTPSVCVESETPCFGPGCIPQHEAFCGCGGDPLTIWAKDELDIGFSSTDENIHFVYSTAKPTIRNELGSCAQQHHWYDFFIPPVSVTTPSVTVDFKAASTNINKAMSLFRLSALLFPDCHVMSYSDAVQTPDMAIFGGLTQTGGC